MRITKLHAPWSPGFWSPLMQNKYGFESYSTKRDKDLPVVVFGCYGRGTKRDVINHRGLCVIVWSGGDSVRLHEDFTFTEYCKINAHRIFHIAHSHWIQVDLAHYGLKFFDIVVIPVNLDTYSYEKACGDSVYHYGTHQRMWYYGTHIMKKLEKKWGQSNRYPNIHCTVQSGYKKPELYKLYKDSFIGVRLTEHDNMAMSVVEMGMMGRRSIFNGDVPCAIPYPCPVYDHYEPLTKNQWVWQDESLVGIVEKMIFDYRGTEPDPLLAEEMREFIYDDEKWLNTEYYD